MTVIVIGQHYWGQGNELAEAKQNFKKQGGRLTRGYTVLTFDAETTFDGVDQMGRVHFTGNEPDVTEVESR